LPRLRRELDDRAREGGCSRHLRPGGTTAILASPLREVDHDLQRARSPRGGTARDAAARAHGVVALTDTMTPIRRRAAGRMEVASGFEPLSRGFADLRLNRLATPPPSRTNIEDSEPRNQHAETARRMGHRRTRRRPGRCAGAPARR